MLTNALPYLHTTKAMDMGMSRGMRNPLRFDPLWEFEVSPANLIGCYIPTVDSAAYWRDMSGKDNLLQQDSAGARPTLAVANGAVSRVLAGNDYQVEREYDDETGVTFWPTYPGLTTTATAAKIRLQGLDLTQYAVASGDSTHRLVLKDSAGAVIAWGYIRGADSAETLTELITDGDMEAAGVTAWTSYYNPTTKAKNATTPLNGSQDLHIITDAVIDYEGVSQNLGTLTAGTLHKYSITYKVVSGKLIVAFGISGFTHYIVTNVTNATKTTVTGYIVIPTTGQYGVWITQGAATPSEFYVDDVSFAEVTAFGTDGVLIGNDIAGTAQTWTGTGAGDPNDPSTLEIYKAVDLTGDFSFGCLFRADDGRPAADAVLFAKADYTAGEYGLSLKLMTTGKYEMVVSSDGATAEGKITDAAVLADGAQTVFADLLAVYDNAGTVIFYVSGAAVASSNLGAGGPPVSIFDTFHKFVIGSESEAGLYFSGDMAVAFLFSRALTAAQANRRYQRTHKRWYLDG